MKQRCYNENNPDYKNYGQRGIKVCDVWLISYKLFEEWSLLNGYVPGLSLDRENPNDHYSPQNCRWVDDETQATNKRNIKLYDYKGKFRSLAQICRLEKLDKRKIWHRMYRQGLSLSEAIKIGDSRAVQKKRIDTLKHRCEELGINYNAVKIRKYKYGLTADEAIEYYL